MPKYGNPHKTKESKPKNGSGTKTRRMIASERIKAWDRGEVKVRSGKVTRSKRSKEVMTADRHPM
jgi:hypothetical protein